MGPQQNKYLDYLQDEQRIREERQIQKAEYKHNIRAFKEEKRHMENMKERNLDVSERYGKFEDIKNLSTRKFKAKPVPRSNQPGLYQEMEDQRKYEKANYHRVYEDIEERKKLKKKGKIDQNNVWYMPPEMRMEELQRL